MSTQIRQELLNRSFAHVVAQGVPAFTRTTEEDGKCFYNSKENNLRCAAAIFMFDLAPDTLKFSSMEFGFLSCNTTYKNFIEPEAVQESFFVSTVLQIAHDRAAQNSYFDGAHHSFIATYKQELHERITLWNQTYSDAIVMPE